MRDTRFLILAVVVLLGIGCTNKQPWDEAGAQLMDTGEQPVIEQKANASNNPTNRWSGRITAYAVTRPPIPNSRLQLPAVSPDGKRIAYLKSDDPEAVISSDGLITGKGLNGISLWVRSVDEKVEPTAVAYAGACWPSWSADGRILAFVTFDQDRRSALGLFDVQTGVIERKAVGLRCVLMPTIAPDHAHIAICAYGELPDHTLIFIIDRDTNKTTPGPPAGDGAQLLPRWINSDTLIYLETSRQGVELKRWTLGDARVATLAQLPGPTSIFDAQHLLTCVDNPLRPDIGAFAYYNPVENRIEMLDLNTGKTRVLPEGFQACSWWGDDWLVASSDDRVELVSSRRTSGATDQPRMIRAVTGRWLPIWADHDRQSVLLIGESEEPDMFSLMQLWLVAEDDG